ncbi:MAG: hypothetical protein LBU51_05395 [Bacteroidales bacterium]|nr:hypothetical protein [Bacteroidales bacterium]
MMRIQKLMVFIGIVVAFSACKPKFDVYDDYKDIVFAYGVFNIHETTHYFKIYKGFQTDENIYDYARQMEWNKLYFDSLEVYLEERVNNEVRRTYPFDTTTAIPKDPGIFPSPLQILYKNRNPLTINTTSTYRFVIKNKYSNENYQVYADAKMIGDFYITNPASSSNLDLTTSHGISCAFKNPDNGSAFEVYQVFKYIEVDKITHHVEKKSLRRKVSADFCQPGNSTKITHRIDHVYNLIGATLEVNDQVVRYTDDRTCIEYEVWVCGASLATYMKLNELNSATLGNKIDFSNFIAENKNAYGIFSSRNSSVRVYDIDSNSEDSLVQGQYTKHLGFKKWIEYVP